jgi:hypothetical protein
MALTQVDQGLLGTYAQYTGFKNRILNGQMQIDQRNAGASVTPTNGQYTLDRWAAYAFGSATGKFSVQRNAGSVTPPSGYTNYLGATSTSSYSVASGDITSIYQAIEGFNVADLGWGAAGAQPISVSFWVRSSLTGTFSGALKNESANRNYPFTFTISASNTWEYKTLTIAGDTTGTWNTTNGRGLVLVFSLGTGSTYSGTAGAWAAGDVYAATGATSVVGTNGATFYITGVQLEKGSTATSFDYRPYGTELQLAQRYYYKNFPGSTSYFGPGQCYATTTAIISTSFKTTMRIAPTALEQSGTAADYRVLSSNGSGVNCSSVPAFSAATTEVGVATFTVASGIVAGNATFGTPTTTAGFLAWSAEL